MRDIIGLVLGGGKGSRLFPLTAQRSKPAVPLAAKYRLIDIPIANCINSGVDRIYLLTQFNSVSLHRHIRQTYNFDGFHGGFVEILAAQQTIEGADWYQGTADAVRKNLRYIQQPGIKHVMILSGDQLYRMDYRDMLKTHLNAKADVTIGALPVDRDAAKGFGIMQLDDNYQVKGFVEKPKTDKEIDAVRTDPAWIDSQGIDSKGRDCLASMGIYLFNRDLLVELLEKTTHEDFGKEVFPMAIDTKQVNVHLFDGYWEDIGTIKSFYDTNLELANPNPPFEFYRPDSPIYTRPRFLPASKVSGTYIDRTLIADGCVIEEGTRIENSVIGLRCRIGKNVTIKNSIIMGADYFESEADTDKHVSKGTPIIGIGDGCVIDRSIIDKNCRLGEGAIVVPDGRMDADLDNPKLYIRDGILVAPKDTTIPPGWKIS
ncbi:glucose-1-phosphate adenylyltransferase [Rubinisphaera sp.]|uniref:glucose-1-phosphate adenylyltransferase n=1 Tax=Rubinisphaera sp. TaxID=2024857 RepID=UPI000C0EAFF7|nr:glucose-1-phosphate adenylyltransferase [Rubinisphaera sp.]MBV09576.1 glucose-1-phosphate adenylyltransferase [Rubinisphaera sp.]|tara:strand:+ start:8940 stop:10229 length:1290 start_codon:yes stop_codon:yes gene_type:complete